MASLLMDTHALIWMVEGEKMRAEAKQAINLAGARQEPIYVSPISAWERGMLVAKGRLSSRLSPREWFLRVINHPLLSLADMGVDILTESSFLPQPVHGDPADRILIATARARNLTLVTHDSAILRYAERGHLAAIAC